MGVGASSNISGHAVGTTACVLALAVVLLLLVLVCEYE
jgi:hypothetical protein